jgi:hypothetical protein
MVVSACPACLCRRSVGNSKETPMDWFLVVTPLFLVSLIYLLVFVGCGLEEEGAAAETVQRTIILQWGPLENGIEFIHFSATVTPGSLPPATGHIQETFIQPGQRAIAVQVHNAANVTFTCSASCTIKVLEGPFGAHDHELGPVPKEFKLGDQLVFSLHQVVEVDWNTKQVIGHTISLG